MPRSLMAHFASTYFSLQPKLTEAQTEAELEKLRASGQEECARPKNLPTSYRERVFFANENATSRYTVFYIHGGGYEHDFSPFHWRFIEKLVDKTDACVIAPAYHLIPFGDCQDAFDLIVPLYEEYVHGHPEKKIILMGDSAGGGLALALAEQFKERDMRLPDELILMSPWVDVSMENPDVLAFVDKDPWLSVPWLKVCGRYWAGARNVHDWQVSPLNGNVRELTNVTLFVGTRELFYPDVTKLFSIMDKPENELIIGQDMNHVFPLLPIPEARSYQRRIFETVKR